MDGIDQPFRIYLTCHKVLLANQDRRAGNLLETSRNLLQARAAAIEDLGLRQTFLENVPWHWQILEPLAE